MDEKAMLSDGEFEIMECVWASEKAPTQTGIMRWVNEHNNKTLKVATIATYIRRIIWKGYLEKVDIKDGHPTYHALVSEDEYFKMSAEDFIARWTEDRVLEMAVTCFASKTREEQNNFIRSCLEHQVK